MNSVEQLLSKRWILKRDDRDEYYRVKDQVKNLRKTFQEKLGYSLVIHQQYIKLDKIPGKAEPWMGITEFKSIKEYQYLCYILIFLEDKENEDQFVLSSLSEYVQLQLNENEEYWLNYTNRRQFVNVLKYCIKSQLIIQDDGNTDVFIQNQDTEVLFESTGLSRYFMRHFISDIFDWNEPQDFMQSEWEEEMEDRGIVRRQRIYRRLLLSSGIYREDDKQTDDFAYIKNYRKRIESDFNQLFPCDLHVHRSSAFLILDEECRIGRLFPKTNALDELVVIYMGYLTKKIKQKQYPCNEAEIVTIPLDSIKRGIKKIIIAQEKYLPSTYRKKGSEIMTNDLLSRLIELGFVETIEDIVLVYPVFGKISGQFDEEATK